MDFLAADEFLDHLEMHPNGSFVLVKRDPVQPTTPAPSDPLESVELPTHSPLLPEMLGNQIKVCGFRMKIEQDCTSNLWYFRLSRLVTTMMMTIIRITKSANQC